MGKTNLGEEPNLLVGNPTQNSDYWNHMSPSIPHESFAGRKWNSCQPQFW